ncbi:MAG: lanthionine synthetase C family protein [Candidatus Udaeobacter sp.]
MTTRWRPIIDGALRASAIDNIRAIAAGIQAILARPVSNGADASLAGGRAGLAVFYTYLGKAGLAPNAEQTALACLNDATDAIAARRMEPSLYGGFVGIAWSVAHLRGRLVEADDDITESVDVALRDYLGRRPWRNDYDLISGLVGFGVYALERLPSPLAAECLCQVIDRLDELAQHTADGITWFTPPELLPGRHREECPRGYYNLGLAHGVPGVIAFLGRVCARENQTARLSAELRKKTLTLLRGAVAWLLAQKLVDQTSVFPDWIAPDLAPTASRVAWCYGDLGIAVALFLAARCVQESSWEKEALALALNVATRPLEQSGVKDCGLCHGAAGVAHLFNRLFQATGERFLKDTAMYWFGCMLRMRRAGGGITGFPALRRGPSGTDQWIAEPGILVGEAGVALATLAAVTDVESAWDRMLLASGDQG